MTPMHPYWHATDDSETQDVPVAVDSVVAQDIAPSPAPVIRTASRKPAAIVGILLVGAFGYAAFLNSGSLPGQVSDIPSVTLRLTSEGAVPEDLTVAPGVTVNITNEDTIPHVLSFEKLKVNGKPLETSPIFPGSTLKMLVPTTTIKGTYGYVSKTSELSGNLIVAAAAATTIPASSKSSVSFTSSAPSSVSAYVPAGVTDTQEEQPTPEDTYVSVPLNTHTVGTSGQKPVEPLHTGAPLAVITQHKPVSNTSSGPATWFLVAAASVLVLTVTRKAFR